MANETLSGRHRLIRVASPAEALLADATGPAQLLKEHEISARGRPRREPARSIFLGAFRRRARSERVVPDLYHLALLRDGDDARSYPRPGTMGEHLAWAGYITAVLAPFLGAIADKGGPRKPWLAVVRGLMVFTSAGTWIGVPEFAASRDLHLQLRCSCSTTSSSSFRMFSKAPCCPSVAPHSRIGGLSGLAYRARQRLGAAAPGFLPCRLHAAGAGERFRPAHPLFGVDQAAHMNRNVSPVRSPRSGCSVRRMPLFLFTPDRAAMPVARDLAAGHASVVDTVREPQALQQRRALHRRTLTLQRRHDRRADFQRASMRPERSAWMPRMGAVRHRALHVRRDRRFLRWLAGQQARVQARHSSSASAERHVVFHIGR